jgi:hypothetical protein
VAQPQPRTILTDVVAEGTTCLITGSLVDEAGSPLGSSQLQAFTLTLYAVVSGLPIINSRNATNILNAGPGTIDAGGLWTITLTPADNDIVSAAAPVDETHRLLLEWTYGAGAKAGKHEIEIRVRNLDKVA